jgi:hypothetical protein
MLPMLRGKYVNGKMNAIVYICGAIPYRMMARLYSIFNLSIRQVNPCGLQ